MASQANQVNLDYHTEATEYFKRIQCLGHCVWLDSGHPEFKRARFDILSALPLAILENPSREDIESSILQHLGAAAAAEAESHDTPFSFGAIGYFNYEYRHQHYGLIANNQHRPSLVGIFDWSLIIDHHLKTVRLVFLSSVTQATRARVVSALGSTQPLPAMAFASDHFNSDQSFDDYRQALAKIHQHILQGNTYQINFSQRFSGNFSGNPKAAYLHLRSLLPSPFSAYLDLKEDHILSFSPERFISIEGKTATTQPIKGTMARGKTEEEDLALSQRLCHSEKNHAENIMIVDLLRNDFSQSCEPFSVNVPELLSLKSFPNVHHLVSTVTGTITGNISSLEFFLRCFPGGSITGAPKKRSMQIIDSLEKYPRNIYCGSVFYLNANGNMDSNIAIRSVLISEKKIYCWGGGGIIADSDDKEEYEETLQKVGVLVNALKNSEVP